MNVQGKDHFFHQIDGLPMGKSFSPVLADLVMGQWEADLEEKAHAHGIRVPFFCRYADDFLICYEGDEVCFNKLVEELNRKNPAIQVTTEKESSNKSLPFLDLLICRTHQGFETRVYRKNCNTGQIVHWSSSCEPRHKWAGLDAEINRAKLYCSRKSWLRSEISSIRKRFILNGYPCLILEKKISQLLRPKITPSNKPDPKFLISIPYTTAFPKLQKAAVGIGVKFVTRPAQTIGSVLCSRVKHKLPEEQNCGVVYNVPCSCGLEYIGETKNELKDRLSQHKSLFSGKSEKSAFWCHSRGNCKPSWDQTKILAQEQKSGRRLLKEALHIHMAGNRVMPIPEAAAVNRNAGKQINPSLLSIVNSSA